MLTTLMFCASLAEAAPTGTVGREEADIAPLVWKRADSPQMIRLILWSQFWARAQQLNPGSTVNGSPTDLSTDLGIRRARALIFGKPTERMLVLTHFGINNQTFNNARKPQLYIHDAWVEGELAPEVLSVGVGLHYWGGVSRATNESTMGFLTLDGPIFPWVTIERTDQFARQFGVFAKGKLSRLDYRVALNKPFTPTTELVDGGPVDYRSDVGTWAVAGYAKLELAEAESNTLPFLPGTYLGKKRVINLGIGTYWQPDALGQLVGTDTTSHDQLNIGLDVFVDAPVGEGAITAYGLYVRSDYGPDYIRNVGIMNVAGGGDGFAGGGNAYPMIGTGHTLYAQTGYLLPLRLGSARLQPYAASQVGLFDALEPAMVLAEAGANLYLAGQHAKLTAHYRNRPVFSPDGLEQTSRASEGILQVAFRY